MGAALRPIDLHPYGFREGRIDPHGNRMPAPGGRPTRESWRNNVRRAIRRHDAIALWYLHSDAALPGYFRESRTETEESYYRE